MGNGRNLSGGTDEKITKSSFKVREVFTEYFELKF